MSRTTNTRPTQPVTYGAAGGSPLGVLIVWALGEFTGISIVPEVAAAIGSVVGALVGYITTEGRK